MITLKNYSIANDNDIMLHVFLDTEEEGYLADAERFSNGQLMLEKPWIGKVDRKEKTFKIRRIRAGLFQSRASATQIVGRVVGDQNKIVVKFRLVWFITLNLVVVPAFCGALVANYFNDVEGWGIVLAFTAFLGFAVARDVNKTIDEFFRYVEELPARRLSGNR